MATGISSEAVCESTAAQTYYHSMHVLRYQSTTQIAVHVLLVRSEDAGVNCTEQCDCKKCEGHGRMEHAAVCLHGNQRGFGIEW